MPVQGQRKHLQSQTTSLWMGCGAFQSSMPEGEARIVPFCCLSPAAAVQALSINFLSCRTGTYFCTDKSVTAVVIKVGRQQQSLPLAVVLVTCKVAASTPATGSTWLAAAAILIRKSVAPVLGAFRLWQHLPLLVFCATSALVLHTCHQRGTATAL